MSALDAIAYLKSNGYSFPICAPRQFVGYSFAQLLLLGLGALAAFALNDGKQIDGIIGALSVGIGAPEIFKKAGTLAAG